MDFLWLSSWDLIVDLLLGHQHMFEPSLEHRYGLFDIGRLVLSTRDFPGIAAIVLLLVARGNISIRG